MKFLHLIVVNLKRKKLRTLLTIGSFMVALLLYGLLMTIKVALSGGVDLAGVDRLVVLNRVSLIMPLPVAYKEQIQRTPHVADITFATWFGGYYRDMKNFFPNYAVDAESYPRVYSEYILSDEELAAFRADRQGCIISPPLAERFGFKLGDRIPLEGTIWPGTLELNVRGIYDVSRGEMLTSELWFQYAYLEEQRQFFTGTVGWYVVRVDDPANGLAVARAIDTRFRNSPFETKTDTEKAFAAGFANQIGNIRLLILSIGSVVFFTLLLVTGNSIAIAVRERTNELAVMKTVGFSDVSILLLVMAESLVVAGIGGGIGLALAKLFTLGGDPTGGMLPYFYLPGKSVAGGFGLALAIGVAAGIVPAVGAMRLKIVDALRKV